MEINRKRVARRLASGLVAGALAFGGLALSGTSPAGALPVELDSNQRIGGVDRYSTAALVSAELEDYLDAETETLIVANGQNFPDALAASALTGAEAPILLVTSDSIPGATRDRMARIADSVLDVYVIGGEAAVSAAVFADIEVLMPDSDVVRIAGENRYATAVAVAEEIGLDNGVFALASGEGFADAVSIGSWSSATATPILLANGSGLPDATEAALEEALDEDASTRVIIVGGPSAVGSGVEEDLADMGYKTSNVTRVAGPDRYVTNLLWNLEHFDGESTIAASALGAADVDLYGLGLGKYLDTADRLSLQGRSATLVSGTNFADALTAGPLAAAVGSHVVLVDPTSIGSAALTLAGAAGTSVVVDSFAAVVASLDDAIFDLESGIDAAGFAGAGGGTFSGLINTDGDRALQDIWVIGGLTAVPSGVVDGVAAAASSTVTCSISVGGANDDNATAAAAAGYAAGPDSAVIAFSSDVSQNGTNFNGALTSSDEYGERYYIEGIIPDVVLRGRTDISATADLDSGTGGIQSSWLDLNGNGAADALVVTFDEQEEGARIVFSGYDGEDAGYVDATPALDTGAGLRDFASCEATVARDRTAPTVSVSAVAGGTIAYVKFSEKVQGDGTDSVVDILEDVIKALDTTATPAATCTASLTDSDQIFTCAAGTAWEASGSFTFAVDKIHDLAGNTLAATTKALKAAGDVDAPTLSVAAECAKVAAGGFKADKWGERTNSTPASDDDAVIDVAFGADTLSITRGSGISLTEQNDWTFTFEHVRGTLIPSVVADGTAVTVTFDRYVHDATDVQEAINRSSIGDGGLTPKWSAEAADPDGLISVDNLGTAFDSSGGTPGTHSCLVTITSSTVMFFDELVPEAAFSDIDTVGEFTLRIGGRYVDGSTTCDEPETASETSTKLYCMVENITETGTVRVDMLTQYVDDSANMALKSATTSI